MLLERERERAHCNCGEDGMTILVGNGGLCGGYEVAWGLVRKGKKIMCSALQKEMSTCIDFFVVFILC